MTERDPRTEQIWERGWDGHEKAQRRRLARLSLEEKLTWLEEAQRLCLRILESRKSQGLDKG